MKNDKDNISRTISYQRFFLKYPDIAWAFLASMVSRNTGWNMTDLYSPTLEGLLGDRWRRKLLLTLERANSIIFRDAYPQLLIYHYSIKQNRPLFHLLDCFSVSRFIKNEWRTFWHHRDRKRLLYALIVNEQHVIHEPVILHPFYRRKVFHHPFFILQELLHFNCILFPADGGELYGCTVTGFNQTWNRINLGKRLASILFHPQLYGRFLSFALSTEPTGSRYDYWRLLHIRRGTPFLRTVVPRMHNPIEIMDDWSLKYKVKKQWMTAPPPYEPLDLSEWYSKKRMQLQLLHQMNRFLKESR